MSVDFKYSLTLSLFYSYWAPGEPNDTGKEEDCAEVYTEHDTVKNWNDKSCSAKLNWICERGGVN
uniref:C-type lectin domain-containing protein n=1 Tax=Paramormyrops kingsleyae TaxID=1676925 RepID=A0A3B3S1Q3_9TELE